jgi:hypothetical protein
VLVAAIVAVGAAAVLQTVPPTEVEAISGRYLFPAMVAVTIVLAAGWRHLWPWSSHTFRTTARLSIPVIHLLFIAILVVPFLAK